MRPTWIPQELNLRGTSIEDDYVTLHEIFNSDLRNPSFEIEGIPVMVDLSPDKTMPQYCSAFMHFVTRMDHAGLRTIDYSRAKKLHWIKPVIENYSDSAVSAFWSSNPNGSQTLYFWMPDYDFMVVVKPAKSSNVMKRVIVTAFHVERFRKKQFQSLYGRAARIL